MGISCKKCNIKKDEKEFYKNNLSTCKTCKKKLSKEKYKNNKEYNENKNINEINNKLEFISIKLNSLETMFDEINKNGKNKIDYNWNHLKTTIIIIVLIFLLNEYIKLMELLSKKGKTL